MKKIIFSFVMLLALATLGSCVVQSSTTIKFVDLPEAVYTATDDETKVQEFKKNVTVEIDEIERTLEEAESLGAIVTGLDLKNPGKHTLVVTYKSFSVTFNYEVVQESEAVKDEKELREALNNEKVSIIKLNADIASSTRFVIERSIVIYGNGHKISVDGDNRVFHVSPTNNSEVYFFDLTLYAGQKGAANRAISVHNTSNTKIVVDNCDLEADHYAIQLGGGTNYIDLTVKNGSTVKGWSALYCWAMNSNITFIDSTLTGEKTTGALNFGVFAFDSENANTGKNNTLTVENCVVTSKVLDESEDILFILNVMGKYSNSSQSQYMKDEYKDCVATGNICNFINCNINPEDGDSYWQLGSVEKEQTEINVIENK